MSKQELTREQKIILLLEDKDAHFTANWVVAKSILSLIEQSQPASKVEAVKEILQQFLRLDEIDRTSYQAGINAESNLKNVVGEICQLFSQPEVKWEDTVLTPEELKKARQYKDDVRREICGQCTEMTLKAQAKHTASLIAKQEREAGRKTVVEWGNGTCIEHGRNREHVFRLRRECPKCWQAFLKGLTK